MSERGLGQFGTLQVLVVKRERQQGRELFRRFRTVDVGRDLDAVAHGHEDVLFRDHADVGGSAIVIDRRPVAGERELKDAIGRRLFHHVLDGSREASQMRSAASVPIPKFASLCGARVCELRNQKDTSIYDSSAVLGSEVSYTNARL